MKIAWMALLVVACGGSHPEPEHGGSEHGAEKGEQHEKMSPALAGFHDVLRPVWHSEPGAVRAQKACDASQAMVDKVAATDDPELVTAVSTLAKTCMSQDRSQVEQQLSAVHERFHALMMKR